MPAVTKNPVKKDPVKKDPVKQKDKKKTFDTEISFCK